MLKLYPRMNNEPVVDTDPHIELPPDGSYLAIQTLSGRAVFESPEELRAFLENLNVAIDLFERYRTANTKWIIMDIKPAKLPDFMTNDAIWKRWWAVLP